MFLNRDIRRPKKGRTLWQYYTYTSWKFIIFILQQPKWFYLLCPLKLLPILLSLQGLCLVFQRPLWPSQWLHWTPHDHSRSLCSRDHLNIGKHGRVIFSPNLTACLWFNTESDMNITKIIRDGMQVKQIKLCI